MESFSFFVLFLVLRFGGRENENDYENENDLMPDPAAMRREAGAEAYEPEVAVAVRAAVLQGFLEGEEHRGAAHVAVVAQDARRGVERVGRDDRRDGFDDVATAGVRDDAGDGPVAALL